MIQNTNFIWTQNTKYQFINTTTTQNNSHKTFRILYNILALTLITGSSINSILITIHFSLI